VNYSFCCQVEFSRTEGVAFQLSPFHLGYGNTVRDARRPPKHCGNEIIEVRQIKARSMVQSFGIIIFFIHVFKCTEQKQLYLEVREDEKCFFETSTHQKAFSYLPN